MSRGYTERVTRLRAGQGPRDPYSGEPSEDWEHPVKATIARSLFEPDDPSEDDQARRDATTSSATLTSLGYPDIKFGDRIERQGVTWKVTGMPQRWPRPRPHTVTLLTWKEG